MGGQHSLPHREILTRKRTTGVLGSLEVKASSRSTFIGLSQAIALFIGKGKEKFKESDFVAVAG